MKRTLPLLVLLSNLSCGPGTKDSPLPVYSAPEHPAKIQGQILFEGTLPKAVRLNMAGEAECHVMHTQPVLSQNFLINSEGGFGNVFVWIKEGLKHLQAPPPPDPVHLDQRGCLYVPGVVGVQIGQSLEISNSDSLTHNVHPMPEVNYEWNRTQRSGAAPLQLTYTEPELMIPVKCNLHPWMRAYINMVPHPFFSVTGEDGRFEIGGLPAGSYVLEAIHANAGRLELPIILTPDKSTHVTLSFKSRPKSK